ncbi:ABC transporter substrate-binding protein [Mesoflavibacter zeaxanthinifaciens]|uniref:ABC transporter substrate-binding protein n=1 Tax=Mesoflavibacter zeaxanthinifaciens TaxID=393060 RepID=UPI003A8CFDDA
MNKKIGIIALVLIVLVGGYFVYQSVQKEKTSPVEELETIKIGAILPLTGPAGSLGVYYKNGIELKVNEINDNGGFYGRKIELFIEDSKTSPKDGVNAANKLIATKDKPLFVFSHLSSISIAISPILKKYKIPLIAVSASDKLLDYDLAIRNYITPQRLAAFSFNNFHNKLNIKNFALIYVNDDFGNSVAENFKLECKNNNVNIVYDDVFNLTETDYKNLVLKIINSNPEGVYITGYGQPLGILIKQLKDYKYKGKICTGIEITQPELIDFLGDYANDIYFPNILFNNNSEKEKNVNFNEEYHKLYHKKSFSASAMAYDGIQIMLDAYQKAGYDTQRFIEIMNMESTFNSLNGELLIKNREIKYPFVLNKLESKKIINVE